MGAKVMEISNTVLTPSDLAEGSYEALIDEKHYIFMLEKEQWVAWGGAGEIKFSAASLEVLVRKIEGLSRVPSRLTVYLGSEEHAALREVAHRLERSVSWVIRKAWRDYKEKNQ